VFTIHLPPLRERGDDLPMLVSHYIRNFDRELGREVRQISPEALAILADYSWPGNIRELQSILKQALLRATGSVLVPSFLPDLLVHPEKRDASHGATDNDGGRFETFINDRIKAGVPALYALVHAELDRILLPLVYRQANGNQHQAARLLGIARQTLRQKLRDLGLSTTDASESDEGDRE